MIIGSRFPNDDNIELMDVQMEEYGKTYYYLYFFPREKYLQAARLLRVKNDLIEILENKQHFDHRVLQEPHDIIAAYFRFNNFRGGEMPLPLDQKSYRETIRESWLDYFYKEVKDITDFFDHISWEIINAVAYQNTNKGYEAEDILINQLYDKYGCVIQKLSEK